MAVARTQVARRVVRRWAALVAAAALVVTSAAAAHADARIDPGVAASRSLAVAAQTPTISAQWSATQVTVGQAVRLTGRMKNPHGVVGGTMRLDRQVDGRWRVALTRPVPADGRWSVRIGAPKTPGPARYRVVWLRGGSGSSALASAELPTLQVFRVHTYDIRTKGLITADVAEFAGSAAATYADERGWRTAYQRFERVRGKRGDFTLWLAEASTVPTFSKSCSAAYSCRVGRNVIINQTPWLRKTRAFTGDLRTYRHMVINHETGHWLSVSHRGCSRRGALAPVMMQQSKGLKGCRFNAWPLDSEVAAVRR